MNNISRVNFTPVNINALRKIYYYSIEDNVSRMQRNVAFLGGRDLALTKTCINVFFDSRSLGQPTTFYLQRTAFNLRYIGFIHNVFV